MTSTGVYIKNLGDMFNVSFTKHLKYNLNEADSFKDLFSMKEQVYQSYLRADRGIIDKKRESLQEERCHLVARL